MLVPFLLFAPSTAFCIPPNPVLKALRMRAEANLYKIRTCRNIAGMERQLEPYAAPTDAESGLPTIGAGGQLILPGTQRLRPTPYRYAVIIERAKQFVQLANQVEAAMLAALEKRDIEEYNLRKARQDMRTAQTQVQLQVLRVQEAKEGWKLAYLQRGRAEIQATTYEQWINAGQNQYEKATIEAYQDAGEARAFTAFADLGLETAKASTELISGGSVAFWAGIRMMASMRAIHAETAAQVNAAQASFERRLEEWKFQLQLAVQDVLIGQQQMTIANNRIQITAQEQTIAEMQSYYAKDIVEFLGNKFTNVELYDWMSDVLERVYRFFLQQATAVAQLAANQLSFERQEAPPPFILADYWEAPTDGITSDSTIGKAPDRRGLTGSARLLQDIYQLDQYAFDTDKRKLQLTKTISLARLDPYAFQRFTETGVLPFKTTLDMFDRDFPGHYLRLIKRMRTSVVALIPPSQGIRATLVSGGTSRVVIGGDIFQTVVVRRSLELVALTSPVNATGLFELDPQSEMLLPFEGMGVDTSWELRMPRAANQFDYHTIADVLITIEYTALNSFDYYQQVIQSMRPTISADRLFSFRNQFADAWYDLHNPDQTDTPMIVRFTTERADFPSNIDNLKIQQVLLAFVRAEGSSFEVPVEYLRFAEQGSAGKVGGAAISVDGIISTRRGNAGSWTAMIGKSPAGTWELALTDPQVRDWLDTDTIEDILLIITYSGRTPEWPA